MTQSPASNPEERRRRVFARQFGLAFAALGAGVLAYVTMPGEMDEAPRRMAAIFAVALVLWVSEAIPLFATSLVVIALQAWWIATPADLGVDIPYTSVFNALSNPVIFLFLGGFILARSVQQERIDVQMAGLLLRAFGAHPWSILAGVMLITAAFSMWMSNTATTAMMVVLVQPFMRQIPEGDRFRKGLILSVPFAANIGGIATPIGTPPNAIAMAQLSERGMPITFLEWMIIGVPLMLGALGVMWVALLMLFRPSTKRLTLNVIEDFHMTPKAAVVYATFGATVALWLTSAWHGAPTAVVAVIPAAVLTLTRVIDRDDFNRLEWNILVLIAGGIALGNGMTDTGLDAWIVRLIPGEGVSLFALIAILSVAAVLMSTVISNTVAANILLPIGLAMTGIATSAIDLQVVAVMVAVMSSFAMGLPISTPPNAIAYGTGQISSRDMLRVGGMISVTATVALVLTGPSVVSFILERL